MCRRFGRQPAAPRAFSPTPTWSNHLEISNIVNTFSSKIALVTGATSGIDRATAIAFAREGAKVVVSGRREKEGNETVEFIRKGGGEATFVKTDVTSESDVAALLG